MPSTEPAPLAQTVILRGGPFDGERRSVDLVEMGVTRALGQKDIPHMALPNVIKVVGDGDEPHVYEKRAGGGYYLHRGLR